MQQDGLLALPKQKSKEEVVCLKRQFCLLLAVSLQRFHHHHHHHLHHCSSCRHFRNWEERYRDRQRGVGRSREGGFVLVHDLSSLECLSKLPVAICNSTSGNLAIAGGDHEPETLTNELGSALPVLAPVSGHGIPGGRIASHLHGNHDS